jgi:hypothetical protein
LIIRIIRHPDKILQYYIINVFKGFVTTLFCYFQNLINNINAYQNQQINPKAILFHSQNTLRPNCLLEESWPIRCDLCRVQTVVTPLSPTMGKDL